MRRLDLNYNKTVVIIKVLNNYELWIKKGVRRMKISEKMDIFYQATIDAANEQAEGLLQECKRDYQKSLEEYEENKAKTKEANMRLAKEHLRKAVNRQASEEILKAKMTYHAKQEEKKEELFALVQEKLDTYRKSDAYLSYLKKKVQEAVAFSDGKEVVVSLDKDDAKYLDMLKKEFHCEWEISDITFGGGIKAVIPEKNVLMDESLGARFATAKEHFSF